MRESGGSTPPRHLSAVPVQRTHAAPGSGATGSGSGATPPVKRRTRYTARAAVLLLVFCALVLALAYPLQQYVSQNAQLDKIQRQNDQQATEVAQLKQQLTDWKDPAFVEIQARRRLHFVMPGETRLTLLGPSGGLGSANGSPLSGGVGTAWYGQLWNSVTTAAEPGSP
jgi:cell division protein FtsB